MPTERFKKSFRPNDFEAFCLWKREMKCAVVSGKFNVLIGISPEDFRQEGTFMAIER